MWVEKRRPNSVKCKKLMTKRYTCWRWKNIQWYSKQMEIKGKHEHLHSYLANQTKEIKGSLHVNQVNNLWRRNKTVNTVWLRCFECYVCPRLMVSNTWFSIHGTVWEGNGIFRRPFRGKYDTRYMIWGCEVLPHCWRISKWSY